MSQEAIGKLLGVTREWVSKLENDQEEFSEFVRMKLTALEAPDVTKLHIGEMQHRSTGGGFPSPKAIVEEIERHHFELMAAAKGDPVRLGWIREQQERHLEIPSRWLQDAPASNREPVPQNRKRGGRITLPSQTQVLSTHDMKPMAPPGAPVGRPASPAAPAA